MRGKDFLSNLLKEVEVLLEKIATANYTANSDREELTHSLAMQIQNDHRFAVTHIELITSSGIVIEDW